MTAGFAVTGLNRTWIPRSVAYARTMVGAAGTAYELAVTCGEVSTTSAEVESARAPTTDEIRRRRERPWVFEVDVCVITGGYSHTI